MKKIGFVLILVLIIANGVRAGLITPDSLFAKANQLYTKKQYSEAIVYYERIIKSGYISAEIYYNIGNTYYKMGNYPYAILYYEKAKLLDPSNNDIEFNLAKAKTFTIDKFEIIPELYITSWIKGVINSFSSNIWAIFALIFFLLSTLLIIGYFLFKSRNKKKLVFTLSIILVVFTIITITFSFKTKEFMENPGTAIVTTPTVSIKASPDYESTDVFILHGGTKLNILRQLGEWFEIEIADGKKGWIEATAIEKI